MGLPGTYAFPTDQTYNTGETIGWVGTPGSNEPAPALKTQAGAPSPTTTSVPGAGPDLNSEGITVRVAGSSGGPATTAAAGDVNSAAAAADGAGGRKPAFTGATVTGAVVAALVLVGLGSLLWASARRRRGSVQPPTRLLG